MELVYLWVKEYKNIMNQGFNFSLRFNKLLEIYHIYLISE